MAVGTIQHTVCWAILHNTRRLGLRPHCYLPAALYTSSWIGIGQYFLSLPVRSGTEANCMFVCWGPGWDCYLAATLPQLWRIGCYTRLGIPTALLFACEEHAKSEDYRIGPSTSFPLYKYVAVIEVWDQNHMLLLARSVAVRIAVVWPSCHVQFQHHLHVGRNDRSPIANTQFAMHLRHNVKWQRIGTSFQKLASLPRHLQQARETAAMRKT